MMYRLYHSLIVAFVVVSMMFVGCKKAEERSFEIPSESILIEVGHAGDMGTTSFKSQNISAIDVVSVVAGWEVVEIDLSSKSITVKSPSMFDNDEKRSGTISLAGYTPLGTKVSISLYVAILDNPDVDLRQSPANCYIANKPATRYLFNPYVGGNSVALDTEYIEIIWQTTNDIIKYVDLQDGVASFYVEELTDDDDKPQGKLQEGNALIGAYDAAGELLWSWHIWLTNSDPERETVVLNGRELMNINLGADCNSQGEKDKDKIGRSYGMYYQWGRRTPIIGPQDWRFSMNADMLVYKGSGAYLYFDYVASDATVGSIEWAESNPTSIIVGCKSNNYDWMFEGHDDALWSTTSKSDHDPCPAGWRIPDSSIYEGLTISSVDDELSWQEAQGMYGWNLVDQNSGSYFFSAAGRRNYLDGHLDIVNDDEVRPVPWSGYYWTATAVADGDAHAMFFDLNSATRTWNGFDAQRKMHRANAMPVRCVRE